MEDYRDELYHHGVKGMKWGVRKKERYSSIRSKRDAANTKSYSKYDNLVERGKLSRQEGARRYENESQANYFRATSQKRQAKADFYRERAGMQKKEKHAARDIRKAERLEKKAKAYEEEARETEKMSKATNKVYDTKLKSGEKIAVDLLMSTDAKNTYLQQRQNMSATEAIGRNAAEEALKYAMSRGL